MTLAQRTRPLRIAMIGQRGVPATYGGVERHVEEMGARLAARGHEVTVYSRGSYVNREQGAEAFRGMRVQYLPALENKHLEAISHSFLSSLHAAPRRYDVIHYHSVGPGLASPVARFASGARVVLTVHGLDGDRAKWGPMAQQVLDTATWMSARVPNATVVVSKALAEHYRRRYHAATEFIPNGVASFPRVAPGPTLARLGLQPGRYLLFVGRFVPEKAPDRLIRAFRRVGNPGSASADLRLVLAGGSSFTDRYAAEISASAAADPRVCLPGYVYGDDLAELYSNAGAFVLPSAVEGMPLTLLEAASYGLPVVVSDIDPHLEVVRSDGPGRRVFEAGSEDDLVRVLKLVTSQFEVERHAAAALQTEILERYSWDAAVDQLEQVYARSIVARSRPSPARK